MASRSDYFLVIVHDVAPPFAAAIHTILSQLQPLLQEQISAALVPCWHGASLAQAGVDFYQQLGQFGEHLLHGYEHRRLNGTGWVSWLTNQADEFASLSRYETEARLGQGQQIFKAVLGIEAEGFIPPAWQWGHINPTLLSRYGLRFGVGFHAVYQVEGKSWPLATWSWDAGRIASLGWVTYWVGFLRWFLRPRATPCLVFHPSDEKRGFLPLGVRLVRSFLERGYRPLLVRNLVDLS